MIFLRRCLKMLGLTYSLTFSSQTPLLLVFFQSPSIKLKYLGKSSNYFFPYVVVVLNAFPMQKFFDSKKWIKNQEHCDGWSVTLSLDGRTEWLMKALHQIEPSSLIYNIWNSLSNKIYISSIQFLKSNCCYIFQTETIFF